MLTHKKRKRSVAVEYPGRCVAGVNRHRFKVFCGVIALSSDVSPYLALGAALFSGSLVSVICVPGWCLLWGPVSVYSGVRVPCGGLRVGVLFRRYPVCGFTCA